MSHFSDFYLQKEILPWSVAYNLNKTKVCGFNMVKLEKKNKALLLKILSRNPTLTQEEAMLFLALERVVSVLTFLSDRYLL